MNQISKKIETYGAFHISKLMDNATSCFSRVVHGWYFCVFQLFGASTSKNDGDSSGAFGRMCCFTSGWLLPKWAKMGFETIGNYIYEITVFLSTKTKICWRNVYVCVKWEKRIENKSASFSSLFQSCFHLMNLMRLRSWVALSGTGQWTFGIALERCFFPGGCPFQCWCTEGYGL